MLDFLKSSFTQGPSIEPWEVLARLIVALAMGGLVGWIYRRTRKSTEITASFPTTLILLSVLIAMVTQVIGDNVARAFSLVGALSIVRFRTVVRDTEDTAYVIFSVVVGMAVGAGQLWVALAGISVVGLAAFWLRRRPSLAATLEAPYRLHLRVALGLDLDELLGATLDESLQERELVSIETAKQGLFLDVTYETHLKPNASAEELVKSLNRIEGVQSVEFLRKGFEDD